MIEYHAHVAAVGATMEALGLAAGGAQSPEDAGRLRDAAGQNLPLAWLGSCIDALTAFAGSDAHELDLLTRAGGLWQRATALFQDFHTARIEFELALLRDDIENPLEILNMGIDRLKGVRDAALGMQAELEAIRAEIAALKHVPGHPRQQDQPSAAWGAGNAFLGRRSWAFVQAMFGNAGDERLAALAVGSLAGYAGNVAGSAFLGHQVGGPRRLHRFRDRLARMTLGAWMHGHAATPAPGELAARILEAADPQRRDPPRLADDLAAQIADALATAFPSRPPVDVNLGFQRMMDHLARLEGFRLPPPPEAPPIILGADGAPVPIDATAFDPALAPQDIGPGLTGGVPSGGTATQPDDASGPKGGCGALALLIALILFIVIYVIWCIVRTADGKKCAIEDYFAEFDPGEEPHPSEPGHQTQEGLTVMRQPENAAHVINDLFSAQIRFWQGLEAARRALILYGLIYPDAADLKSPLHNQFLVAFADPTWPRTAVADPDVSFHRYPMTPAEQPGGDNPWPENRGPDWLLHVSGADNEASFAEIALDGFRDLMRGDDAPNLDLDADRGRRHACWQVAPGTSINDPLLAVDILPAGSE